jgi:hypothetical protein
VKLAPLRGAIDPIHVMAVVQIVTVATVATASAVAAIAIGMTRRIGRRRMHDARDSVPIASLASNRPKDDRIRHVSRVIVARHPAGRSREQSKAIVRISRGRSKPDPTSPGPSRHAPTSRVRISPGQINPAPTNPAPTNPGPISPGQISLAPTEQTDSAAVRNGAVAAVVAVVVVAAEAVATMQALRPMRTGKVVKVVSHRRSQQTTSTASLPSTANVRVLSSIRRRYRCVASHNSRNSHSVPSTCRRR